MRNSVGAADGARGASRQGAPNGSGRVGVAQPLRYRRAVGAEHVIGAVRRTLARRALLDRGPRVSRTVLVACSGGADSAGLLYALARLAPELGISLVAASVDHGLRPDAAADVAIAARQAEALSVPFHALGVTVSGGASVQAAARASRYAALRKVAAREGASRIAVGHTRDDQAETVLARLLRGSSLRGLGGVAPRRADGVIRPLLDCARADVRALVVAEGLPFVDDPSNADARFLRARIRADVLPALAALDPGVVAHLAALADDARADDGVLRAAGAALLARAGEDAPEVSVLARARTASRRRALARWAGDAPAHPVSRAHIEALDALVRTGRGAVRLSGGRCAPVVAGRLVLAPGVTPAAPGDGRAERS
jgi:tRNA(Ile)-lysidine synthase